MRTHGSRDRQTDMTKIVARGNFARAPKHKTNFCIQEVNNIVQIKFQIMSYIIAHAHRQDEEQ